jgi:hypothetical protein
MGVILRWPSLVIVISVKGETYMRYIVSALVLGACVASVSAAPAVDGTKDAAYGSALAVQTVQTGFGDNNSELNAGYGVIDSGKLYLMLTGNVEANFNRLEIFVDSKAGGQSVFDSSGNDNANRMDGLVFDAGFTADYHVIFRRGTDLGNQKVDIDFANLNAQSASGYFDVMAGSGLSGTGSTGTGVNANPILLAYDGSNVAGITGGTGAADPTAAAAVVTGLELAFDLGDLGYAGGPIHVMVGVNGSGHDFWSNQFLGGVAAPQGNLGGDGLGNFTGEGAIDFTTFSGNQFFTVGIPEPGTVGLLALGVMGLVMGRRRV